MLIAWTGLLACGAAPTLLLAADPARDGVDGADGPYGAMQAERVYAARVTDAVDTTLVYPVDADGAPLDAAPTVVFDHGGLVEPERYVWLATHLATRGYAVALPRFPLLLAIFEPGDAEAALDGILDDDVGATLPAAVGGHSLGGVTGAMAWADDARFTGLFLLASFPAASTAVEARTDGAVLSLIGDEDGSADYGDTAAGFARFEAPGTFGLVAGLTHYGWTDDVAASEAAKEQEPSRPVDDARRDALRVFDAWTDATLRGDAAAQALLDTGSFPNVTVGL